MKAQDEIQEFIQLKAQGLSYRKIAEKLGVSKTTLISWSKKYLPEIANLKSENLEALQEEYCLSIEARVHLWGKILNRIVNDIADRPLESIATEKLFDMMLKAQKKLEESYIEPDFLSEDDIERYRDLQELMNDLQDDSTEDIDSKSFTRALVKFYQNFSEIQGHRSLFRPNREPKDKDI